MRAGSVGVVGCFSLTVWTHFRKSMSQPMGWSFSIYESQMAAGVLPYRKMHSLTAFGFLTNESFLRVDRTLLDLDLLIFLSSAPNAINCRLTLVVLCWLEMRNPPVTDMLLATVRPTVCQSPGIQ